MKKELTPLEREIRRHLAQNITILEPGLSLIKEEFPLQNQYGAGGYIDLLCRDQFGHFVIVELKRSDSAARQAIHEMFKYASLLRSQHNVAPEQIRCVFASTEWHELLTPFSEYTRAVDYPTRGYRLDVENGPDGMDIRVSIVDPLHEVYVAKFSPSHSIYLYQNREERDAALPALERAIIQENIEGACIIGMKYTGDKTRVAYPFANYLAILEFSPAERLRRGEELDPEELEANDWLIEDTAIGRLDFSEWDTIETGYPEKLAHHMRGWEVEDLRRIGTSLQNTLLLPDESLFAQVCARGGRNAFSIYSMASPQFEPSWNRLVEDVSYTLRGNSAWSEIILSELARVKSDQTRASVSVKIFNPSDTLTALAAFSLKGDVEVLPGLEIIVDDPDQVGSTLLLGTLSWDGKQSPQSLQPMLTRIFDDDPFNFFLAKALGEAWRYDDALVSNLGLYYRVLKVKHDNEAVPACTELRSEEDRLKETPARCGFDFSLLRYLRANSILVGEIAVFFSENSNFFM